MSDNDRTVQIDQGIWDRWAEVFGRELRAHDVNSALHGLLNRTEERREQRRAYLAAILARFGDLSDVDTTVDGWDEPGGELDAYLDAVGVEEGDLREALLDDLADQVRQP